MFTLNQFRYQVIICCCSLVQPQRFMCPRRLPARSCHISRRGSVNGAAGTTYSYPVTTRPVLRCYLDSLSGVRACGRVFTAWFTCQSNVNVTPKNKPKAGEKEWMSEPASSHEEGSSPCRKSWVLPKSYFHCSHTPAIWIWQRQSKATRRLRFVNEKSRHRDDVSVKLNMRWAAICHRPFLFPILAY